MAGDVVALLDHLGIPQADIMGYSLGGRMTAWLGLNEPQRLRSAILGGIGIGGLMEGTGPGESVVQALEAPSLDEVTDPVGRTFRAFADQTRSDRKALAACLDPTRFVDVDIYKDGICSSSDGVTVMFAWSAVHDLTIGPTRIELEGEAFVTYIPRRAFKSQGEFEAAGERLRALRLEARRTAAPADHPQPVA